MLVDHYRKDFMDKIVGRRVTIIAHQDVDAVCSVKILTKLFKTEGVSYILLSCCGISDMKAKYSEYSSQSDIFILINCGGSVDILEIFEHPPAEKIFFIIDHHRPIHIINYYNTTGQVRLVSAPEPSERIPGFDDIFTEDPEDEEEDSEGEVDEDGRTARMRNAQRAQRRREWLRRREEILQDYTGHSYYSRPSSLYVLEVAWIMSRDDMESIWCTTVALTDALVANRLSRAKYTEYATTVNDHILRITNAEKLPRDCLKIRFERELFLFLYRSWSVYDSVKVTPYTANNLKTWSMDGCRNFHQMLALLGLPLEEVKQPYLNMSLDLRNQLVEMFSSERVTDNFRLPNAVFGSFVADIGFRARFNALDVQMATLATIEDPDPNKSNENKFLEGLDVLNVQDAEAHKNGVEKAKKMLKCLSSQVQMMIDSKQQIQEMGPLIFVQLSDNLIDYNFFKRPASIPILAHFLQHAAIKARNKKKRWMTKPFIIMIPVSSDNFLAVGVEPLSFEQDVKNVFYAVFRVLKGNLGEDALIDYFDGWALLVKISQRQMFIDQLLAISE